MCSAQGRDGDLGTKQMAGCLAKLAELVDDAGVDRLVAPDADALMSGDLPGFLELRRDDDRVPADSTSKPDGLTQ